MEPRNVSLLCACGCVCVFSRVSPVFVGARVRSCACTRARNGPGEGSGLVPRWGPGGPRARRRKRHQNQGVIRAARRGRVRGKGGATFCTSAGHAGVERWARLFDIRGSTPFAPLRSIRTIYTWVYPSLPPPFSPCSAAFDQISVTAVSFQDDGEGRAPLTLA